MNILFIHDNYPGQFRQLATVIGSTEGNNVAFLTGRVDAKKEIINGVMIRNFEIHRLPSETTHHYLRSTEISILRGQAVMRSISQLVEEGFKPDIVITHGGNGLGSFVKHIIPDTILIGLFEWYFTPMTARWLFKDYTLDQQVMTQVRNMTIIDELIACDECIIPTEWQKQQFPQILEHKLKVIFDGIDTNFFKKDASIKSRIVRLKGEENEKELIIMPNEKVLTYATRGMEPLRGFPEFLETAIKLLNKMPDLKIIIAGRDRRAYSYDAPNKSGSWKQEILDKSENSNYKNKIIFTGLLPYNQYRELLQRSDLHCYFTRPYVTSWSLFEAIQCCTNICCNKTEATQNIAKMDESITWVDIDDKETLQRKMHEAIINPTQIHPELQQKFRLDRCLKEWEKVLNDSLLKRSKKRTQTYK